MIVSSNPIDQNRIKHSTAIDFLRILATLIVFMLHTTIFTTHYVDLWGSKWPAVFIFKTPAWAGVWIFFILSGYLIGKGWVNQSYKLTIKGASNFYLKRITKVLIPTWFFIFLCCVLVFPEFVLENPTVIVRFLTLTYNGNPGVDGVGATWYIFSIMQLYLIAPIIYFLLEKINKKSSNLLIIVLVFIVIAGMLYRVMLFKIGADWSSLVYTPSFSNLDLFTSGFILSYITNNKTKITFANQLTEIIIHKIKLSRLKSGSVILLMALIIINCWLYFTDQIFIYQYILPSVYIFIVCFYLFVFEYCHSILGRSKFAAIDVIKFGASNLMHFLSNISFEFYLFHSLVLNRIIRAFTIISPIAFHVKVLIYAAIFTVILAYGYSKIIKRNIPRSNDSRSSLHLLLEKLHTFITSHFAHKKTRLCTKPK